MKQAQKTDHQIRIELHKSRVLGCRLARRLKLDPRLIVEAFLAALEDANQHDLYRIVMREWAGLLDQNK